MRHVFCTILYPGTTNFATEHDPRSIREQAQTNKQTGSNLQQQKPNTYNVMHLLNAIILLAVVSPGVAYNCDDGCKRQARECKGGGWSPEICWTNYLRQAACEAYKLTKCGDAFAQAMGPAYVAMGAVMKTRQQNTRSLAPCEMSALATDFDVRMLSNARLHFDTDMLFSGLGEISKHIATNPEAMTFGYNIYIRDSFSEQQGPDGLWTGWLELLAHELKHTKQFWDRNEDLLSFGKAYFRHFAQGGFKYASNKYEVEGRAKGEVVARTRGAVFNSCMTPTPEPTVDPTSFPTFVPTVEPTEEPTTAPTASPTAEDIADLLGTGHVGNVCVVLLVAPLLLML